MYVFYFLKCSCLYFTIIFYSVVSRENHSENDCLAVVLLTHGINSSFVYARDNPYSVEFLWNSFTPDKCPTLAGKPKLFFLQVIVYVKESNLIPKF